MKKPTKEECDKGLTQFGFSPLPMGDWTKIDALYARAKALARLGPAADSNAISACYQQIEQIFREHCHSCDRITPVVGAATDTQQPAEFEVADWEAKMRAAKTPRARRQVAIAFENAVRGRLPELRRRAASFSLLS